MGFKSINLFRSNNRGRVSLESRTLERQQRHRQRRLLGHHQHSAFRNDCVSKVRNIYQDSSRFFGPTTTQCSSSSPPTADQETNRTRCVIAALQALPCGILHQLLLSPARRFTFVEALCRAEALGFVRNGIDSGTGTCGYRMIGVVRDLLGGECAALWRGLLMTGVGGGGGTCRLNV